jgi:hypothetical protein
MDQIVSLLTSCVSVLRIGEIPSKSEDRIEADASMYSTLPVFLAVILSITIQVKYLTPNKVRKHDNPRDYLHINLQPMIIDPDKQICEREYRRELLGYRSGSEYKAGV